MKSRNRWAEEIRALRLKTSSAKRAIVMTHRNQEIRTTRKSQAAAMKKMRLTQATMTTSVSMAKVKSAKRGRPKRKQSTTQDRPSWRLKRSKPKSCWKLRAIRS